MLNDRLFAVCHSCNLSALFTGNKSYLTYQESNKVASSLKRPDCGIPRLVEEVGQTKKPHITFGRALRLFS